LKNVILLLICPVLISCFACTKMQTSSLKIMTFNIRYGTATDGENSWEYRNNLLIDCLKKHQPDILGTQEALPFQIDTIKAAFPHWKAFGVGRYHTVNIPDRPHESMSGESCDILYDSTKFEVIEKGTYWHSDTPDIRASITWGNGLPRITTWGLFQDKRTDMQFIVMNTHFHWDEPYVSNTAKLIMQKWREIADDKPTILMGDFNLDPTSDAHELFCGKTGSPDIRGNFIDCWQALCKPEQNVGTGHSFTGSKSQNRIDWILITQEFDAKSIKIIYDNQDGQYPSDHYPVLAELSI